MVMIGAATDPYQPAEGRYRLTRGCLEALAAARTPLSIVTRGPLVVRDVDVLASAARRVDVDVNVSIPTLDEQVWRCTEPGTASPRQRLRAVARLAAAGVRTGVGMAPILPGISDRPEQLRDVVRAAREAGAAHLWANMVHLRPGTREHFLDHLARDWPEERRRYDRLFAGRAHLPRHHAAPILDRVARLRASAGLIDRRPVRAAEPDQLSLLPA
jgi:DNA repair photolyase